MLMISAGHHQGAQGARFNEYTEWREARQWRDLLASNLAHIAIPVPTGTLRQKVEFINRGQPTAAVEVHFNSAIVRGRHVGQGCETLHYPGSVRGQWLAHLVQSALAPIFPPDRGIKEGWHRMDRPGIVDYHGDKDGDETINYFLRETRCPAIIIEPEFIHNIELIQTQRVFACAAIAEALTRYMQEA